MQSPYLIILPEDKVIVLAPNASTLSAPEQVGKLYGLQSTSNLL